MMIVRNRMNFLPVWALMLTLAAGLMGFANSEARAQQPESVADLAEGLLGAVVNISTSQSVEGSSGVELPQVPEGSPFREFFDEFLDRQQRGNGRPRQVQSLGSGFIISADGLIVTNNHVIADADEITINFSDGSQLKAQVVGRDTKTDLAVLQVEPETPLPFVSFGDSDTLRVGDWVMAIGNPFGLGGTVTVGIVSARNRNINPGPYDDFIQTDAAINRGNSGGPLFNWRGEVVGINTAIFSPTGGSVGIGFSVPSKIAEGVTRQLIEFGETRRGWLGVRIQQVNEEIADSLGMDRARGALVAGVNPDGPAAGTGLESGDVIITFAGENVAEMRDLPKIVAATSPGQTVEVIVLRDGTEISFTIEIGRLETSNVELAANEEVEDDNSGAAPEIVETLGLKLASISDDLRAQYEIGEDIKGVVVTEVDPNSAAADKGIVAGTVIVEVSQREVSAPSEILDRVEELGEEGRRSALLLLSNGVGDMRFVAVRLEN
ncbi:MAG: DegQ family serine endoprotease [Rhizobiales bacterium]|nr:DegQ family serine endoprotease [Hyphomicrobiales bacterium]